MTQPPTRIVSVLLSLTVAFGALSGCDKEDEEAKKKAEQKFATRIISKVDAACACPSEACASAANSEITKIQGEAKAALGSFPSSEIHSELLPHMERLGHCLAAKL